MVDARLEDVINIQKHRPNAKSTESKPFEGQIMMATMTRGKLFLVAKFKPRLFVFWTYPPQPQISLYLQTVEAQYTGHVDATGAPG